MVVAALAMVYAGGLEAVRLGTMAGRTPCPPSIPCHPSDGLLHAAGSGLAWLPGSDWALRRGAQAQQGERDQGLGYLAAAQAGGLPAKWAAQLEVGQQGPSVSGLAGPFGGMGAGIRALLQAAGRGSPRPLLRDAKAGGPGGEGQQAVPRTGEGQQAVPRSGSAAVEQQAAGGSDEAGSEAGPEGGEGLSLRAFPAHPMLPRKPAHPLPPDFPRWALCSALPAEACAQAGSALRCCAAPRCHPSACVPTSPPTCPSFGRRQVNGTLRARGWAQVLQ
jgi:hypothetical protein